MFGRRNCVAARRVHDDHALAGGRHDIDGIDADTGPRDRPQLAGILEHLRRNLRRRTHDHRIVGWQNRFQLRRILAEFGAMIDRHAELFERLGGRGFEVIGNENARHFRST